MEKKFKVLVWFLLGVFFTLIYGIIDNFRNSFLDYLYFSFNIQTFLGKKDVIVIQNMNENLFQTVQVISSFIVIFFI